MARPVQVDRNNALKSAKRLFWEQGYTATSMTQLLEATGMGSGSFYGAFGNKQGLFERVIDDYLQVSMHHFAKTRESRNGLDAILGFLELTLVDVSDAERHKGCLLVNSALELDDVDDELYAHVQNALDHLHSAVHECIEEAANGGTLRDDIEREDAVGLCMSLLQGLRVESRLGLSRESARRKVDLWFKLISKPHKE